MPLTFRERLSERAVPLIVATALLMQNLDSSILSTSLPEIARDLGSDPIHLKLALTSYLLALAIFIPASGWAADRFGARRVFRWAIVVFAAGSIACGLSDSLGTLVAARVLQGIGGSMMTPVGRLLVLRSTPRTGLVAALAWLTIPALLGPVLGPPLGGFITTFAHWRWNFWINLPIAVAGVLLATAFIPDISAGRRPTFDRIGFLLLGPGLAAFLTGVTLAGLNLAPPALLAMLTLAGVGLLVSYVFHARRHVSPLVDLSLLRLPTFRASVTGGMLFRFGTGALPFLLPLMFQLGFGLSPFQSGMMTFASGVGAMLMKFLAQPILRRFGFRRVLTGSAVLSSVFILAPATFTPATPWFWMIALLFLGGLLRSLLFTSLSAIAYAEIPQERLSSAASFTAVLQELSGTIGITIAAFGLEAMQLVSGSGAIELAHCPAVFVLVAAISLMASVVLARLPADAGASLLIRTGPAGA
ncbi:MAG: DHA2 family efflux MFS transporter permease subunit [Burkholderiaceae bacterium]